MILVVLGILFFVFTFAGIVLMRPAVRKLSWGELFRLILGMGLLQMAYAFLKVMF